MDTGEWPPETSNGSGLINSNGIINTNDWDGPYIDEWRTDPWGGSYRFKYYDWMSPPGLYIKSFGSGGWWGSGTDTDIDVLIVPESVM